MFRERLAAIGFAAAVLTFSQAQAEDLQLPPGITPAMRSACEADVRRMCVGDSPTVAKVRSCVERRFSELSGRCKLAIAAAGLTPARMARKP